MITKIGHLRTTLPALALAGLVGILAACTETAAGTAGDGATAGRDADGRPHMAAVKRAKGWGRGRGGRFCGARMGARIERMDAILDGFGGLDAAQKAAWQGFRTAADGAIAKVRESCRALASASRNPTGPERLERMETMLAVRLDAVRSVRPAYAAFYNSLDEGQRQALDALRGPGKRRWGRHRH